MRVPTIVAAVALVAIASFGLVAYRHDDEFKPNIFHTTQHRLLWLGDAGYRVDFDAHESLVISNWITAHQTGWKLGSSDDFDPHKPQLSCDNYDVEVDTNLIVFQYYKTEADLTNDPSDSFLVIKRFILAEEEIFWEQQISEIKSSNPVRVKFGVPVPP